MPTAEFLMQKRDALLELKRSVNRAVSDRYGVVDPTVAVDDGWVENRDGDDSGHREMYQVQVTFHSYFVHLFIRICLFMFILPFSYSFIRSSIYYFIVVLFCLEFYCTTSFFIIELVTVTLDYVILQKYLFSHLYVSFLLNELSAF